MRLLMIVLASELKIDAGGNNLSKFKYDPMALVSSFPYVHADTGGLTQNEFDYILDYVLNNDGTFMGNLADFINDVSSSIPDFDVFPVDVKASLVDAAVSNSLSTDVIDMINDASVTWAEACFWLGVSLGNYLGILISTEEKISWDYLKLRMQANCQVFYAYGTTLNDGDYDTEIDDDDDYDDDSDDDNYDYYRNYNFYHHYSEENMQSTYNPCSDDCNKFYPYGSVFNDNANFVNDDESSGEININHAFPFFGISHSSLWVNTNGVISFVREIWQYTPIEFPLGNEWKMVAPFWADVDTGNGGNVYWRETTDPKIVARAIKDINTYTCDLLDVVWVFIATWDNTAFYGAHSDASRELRNTFQAVLISDGEKSFAIYNYCDIEWTTGTASYGNTQGVGGTPAQVGFNAGDGVTFFAVPSSFQPEVIDIEETTNVGVPGRYVFQLNGETIIEACSCIEPNCVVVGCSRYEIHTNELKWAEAKTKCEMDGGRLATLNTHDIYTTVRQYMLTNALDEEVKKGFWIGLNDRDSEGNFVWSDGSTLEPNNNHQKDQINGQDCVQLW
uniref:Uncharacterized protein LOC100367463 n=1 Tax=Saccoglossus kowalevskii TaxID=10224 RepID=A0ABM0M7U8_SACKO|nr:PREDICTED: uncharacterized protein LOC100367463 [Saccoglossus kowalevskii]